MKIRLDVHVLQRGCHTECAILAPVSAAETRLVRLLRFGRALVVGSGATLTDFSVFTTCVRGMGMAPTSARLPALLAGACFQFFGNRSYTFRARAGSLSRQAWLFLLAEGVTLALNLGVFRVLVQISQRYPAGAR